MLSKNILARLNVSKLDSFDLRRDMKSQVEHLKRLFFNELIDLPHSSMHENDMYK